MPQSDTQKHFPFLRLPQELRLEVLKHSDLIDTRYDSHLHEAVWVTKEHHYVICDGCSCLRGEQYAFSSGCRTHPQRISSALLLVNRQLFYEAQEVFLSHNRIVLSNGHEKNLEYLQSLPPSLYSRIQHLHLRFNEFLDHTNPVEEQRFCCVINNPEGWGRLIIWIAQHLTLSKLSLSIDLGEYYRHIHDGAWWGGWVAITELDAAMFARAYRRLARPLSKLHGLRTCFVFLPCYFRMEAQMERIAVGDSTYNSLSDGKVPPIARDYQRPHSWPKEEFGHRLYDFAEDLDPLHDSIEERVADCLHKEWWVDMPAFPENPSYI